MVDLKWEKYASATDYSFAWEDDDLLVRRDSEDIVICKINGDDRQLMIGNDPPPIDELQEIARLATPILDGSISTPTASVREPLSNLQTIQTDLGEGTWIKFAGVVVGEVRNGEVVINRDGLPGRNAAYGLRNRLLKLDNEELKYVE